MPKLYFESNKILASQSSNGSSFRCVQDEDEDIFIYQLKTYVKCVYALINQLICITNNECLILHHKAFHTDYILRCTNSNTAQIVLVVLH
jgi:succinylarginine dihydrolase